MPSVATMSTCDPRSTTWVCGAAEIRLIARSTVRGVPLVGCSRPDRQERGSGVDAEQTLNPGLARQAKWKDLHIKQVVTKEILRKRSQIDRQRLDSNSVISMRRTETCKARRLRRHRCMSMPFEEASGILQSRPSQSYRPPLQPCPPT